jgi:hypothetical protein
MSFATLLAMLDPLATVCAARELVHRCYSRRLRQRSDKKNKKNKKELQGRELNPGLLRDRQEY